MRRFAVAVVGMALVAAACGGKDEADANGGDTGASASAAASAASAASAVAGAAVGGATSMKVTLTGGPKPGTYDKDSSTPTCTVGYAGEGKWGNAASDLEDKSGLIGIDLIVPDPAAAKAGTDDFMMAVYLDDRLDPKNQFMIEPKNGKGTGTVKIDDRGGTATVTVQGKTKEGVGVDARIDCKQIMRA